MAGKGFYVIGTQIIGPDGNKFLVKGANINGPGWCWTRDTIQDIDAICDVWKFNTVRLCIALGWNWQKSPNNRDLEAIVDGFVKKGIVVMLEVHDYTGIYPCSDRLSKNSNTIPSINEFAQWWVDIANRFKNNSYVWFNIMNEPGSVPSEQTSKSIKEWLDTHDFIIGSIRAAGAQNIIVCDEHVWGQGCGYFRQPTDSAIIVNGIALTNKYGNIVHSLHMYHAWKNGWDRLERFVIDAHDQNLCVIIGEYGAGIDEAVTQNVARVMFDVCVPMEIGRIFWAWDGSDVHKLTDTKKSGVNVGGGWEIDNTDGKKPGNLSWIGSIIWDDNHGILKAPVPMHDAPVVANGSFENGMSVWLNWGGASVAKGASYNGTDALRIAAGKPGGTGHGTMLEPNKSYTLSAWGKNSKEVTFASDIGIKFKTPLGATEKHIISFTENIWSKKEITFSTPDMDVMIDELVYVYKNDSEADFYADDIIVTPV
ncbi:MAG: cellulase family glycosylhydrolase [Defluviitaleaceae bacterium]|nr:cellulase family glycosylhydrolase [Defluviitaleaceae bacterium]